MYSETLFKKNINRNSFQIGNLVAVPTRDLLIKDGQNYTLEPLVMDVLCILAEHPGHVILREEFINRLWDIDHGSDESLTRAVSVLRKTLRNAGTSDAYIETIPKRGYRLTHPISVANAPEIPHTPTSTTSLARNMGSLLPAALLVVVVSMPIFIIFAMGN